MAGVALVFALAAAGVGAEGFIQASRADSRIDTLRASLASLQSRVSAADRGAANERVTIAAVAAQAAGAKQALKRFSWQLESTPTEAQVARVRDELATYDACMSQVQSEISGLGITRRTDPSKPSAGYDELFTRAPVSASCSASLTGP